MHIRLLYLNKIGVHYRIDFYVVRLVRFTHDLAMHLAAGRHVYRDITLQQGLTTQASIVGKPAATLVAPLTLASRCQVISTRHDAVFGHLALGYQHLAASTDGAPAAD